MVRPAHLDFDQLARHPFVAAVDWQPTLPSTNDHALGLAARESLATPHLVVAEQQTAGRGRGANRWWSSQGALTYSLVLSTQADRCAVRPLSSNASTPSPRPDQWARVALTAGLSLCEALGGLVPHLDFGLKWPNDVMLGGKKLAGILVEIPPAAPPAPRRIVLGMGINVNNSLADAPAELQASAATLRDATGLEFDATQVLLAWLSRFAANLQSLVADNDDLALRWQSRCVLTGQAVELQSGERLLRGVSAGIARDGALLLDTPAGPERIYAAAAVRLVR